MEGMNLLWHDAVCIAHSVLPELDHIVIASVDTFAWLFSHLAFGRLVCMVFTTCDHVVVPYLWESLAQSTLWFLNSVSGRLLIINVTDTLHNIYICIKNNGRILIELLLFFFFFFSMLKMTLKSLLSSRYILWLNYFVCLKRY